MHHLSYTCDKKLLHPDIRVVFQEKKMVEEAEEFQHTKSLFASIKFFIFCFMSALGVRHYNTMGILGYRTYLFESEFVEKILKKKRKNLLDIGAGSGTITEKFEPHVETISCLEPSPSFQRKLQKMGYNIVSTEDNTRYDVITMFNVLDICNEPEKLLYHAINHLEKNGNIILSVPFPIEVRSWDNRGVKKTNHLSQKNMTFEEAVSDFYITMLKKNGLKVTYFTRLPYIVSLPDSKKTTVYDNGLFVCEKE